MEREDYAAIDFFATVNTIAAVLAVIGGVISMALAIAADGPLAFIPGAGILAIGVWGLAFSQILRLAVHVANDVRDTRALTTRIRELLEPREAEELT